jgi:sialate O-acetylesterase
MPGQQHPQVNSESRVRARLQAPQAQSVQPDISGVKYPMTRGEHGVWIGGSTPQDTGNHYYGLVKDGAQVPDPSGSLIFDSGAGRTNIEIPAADQDFYALKNVPHGQLREIYHFGKTSNESPNTAHEWQTWRRSLHKFARLSFKTNEVFCGEPAVYFWTMKKTLILLAVLFCAFTDKGISGELNPLFQNNAVLQCDARVPVWGAARDGEKITVTFAGQKISTVATNGAWKVWLNPMKASATPRTLTMSGDTTWEITNVLVGEVWVAGGQSNMERQLGLRGGQKPIVNWKQEAAAANYPEIRQFYVPETKSFTPQATVKGDWSVCSPETVTNFTAVGYFFASDLFQARHVPIGIIFSSWGGTPAEAWTSEAGLQRLPDFAEPLAQLRKLAADPDLAHREAQAKQDAWFQNVDPGSKLGAAWSVAELDTSDWKTMILPTLWENAGYPDFDGVFWFRRTFDLPQNWDGRDVLLHLGAVDDDDATWVNGAMVGSTIGWDRLRVYRVPGHLLRRGTNVIAVRVLDTGAGGGLYGGGDTMRLMYGLPGQDSRKETNVLSLSGVWQCKQSVSLKTTGWPPSDFNQDPSAPTVLYNAMIAPLLPFAIRGVIWYQGESNVGRERQYRSLFPELIADWRRAWGEGDFPFLFVQIAPFRDMTPEIREAQLLTLEHTTNTAMAVTVDCGDANDIHLAHKQPVGERLSLAARALAYGEKIEYSGPIFDSMNIHGASPILHFTHLGGGLLAKDGELKGFTIAGVDEVFHPASAKIVGDTVVVDSTEVPHPVAVRYGWANVPEGNLFNRAGLPASPFRTDVD